ncbi:hypothetical protein [Brevifollis gellanilyticus]|uniref:Glycosyltransferase RgtA/B/C/D-like domain-containing protein n=1 Tax=Brevifollis gellanilyticus TaxID=748831 RepID=A0A512M464_9BACT|nr:hypothetical protein [Brevifollis gellanilyticus]GEP41529.1 hypothetical protein BGE01nite_08200 [Brevifollis gellanilyticus]
MPPVRPSTPLLWLRWVTCLIALGAILWFVFKDLAPRIDDSDPLKLTMVEAANLELTTQTYHDLQPDFTQSFSEPLNRMIPHRTDGLVQPLWPWIAAWMHDPQNVGATLHGTGMFRLGLTLGFLAVLGFVAARSFSLPTALWVVLMAAFHGFVPVLPFFTGEVFFHIALLAFWLGCLYSLQRNSLWVYGIIGITGALAWLVEDRVVLPVLVVFVLVSSLRAIWGWVAAHFSKVRGISLWRWRNHWLGLTLLAAMFFFVSGPRLAESHELFGQAFYSHVDHVRWLDTPEEAQKWIEQHPNAAALARVPVLEMPTPASALGTITSEQLATRLVRGAALVSRQLGSALPQLLAMLGLLILVTLLTLTCCPKAAHAGERLHPETATSVLFVTASITICGVIALWDASVLPVRHLHGLVMLLALSLAWGAESVLRRARRRGVKRWIVIAYGVAMTGMGLWVAASARAWW